MQRSLRLRLLLGGGVAIAVALAIAWIAMGYLFERHAQRQIEADLIARGVSLISALYTDPEGDTAVDPPPTDPRFEAPASGLYWQVQGDGVLLRSRSLWDAVLRRPGATPSAEWATGRMIGPFGQTLLFAQRGVQLDPQSQPLTVLLAADVAAVSNARSAFSRDLLAFLGVLWAVLALAAWAQVEMGLRPLEDVRKALSGLRTQASARLAEADYPAEAAPLAHAINDLAAARERDLEQARRRAADLAHSLKTPLAAIAAQSRRAREAGASDAADGLERAVHAANRAIDRELARTRVAGLAPGESNGRATIERLIQVIERTEAGTRVQISNQMTAAPVPVSEDVLIELVGPLLENAVRHAHGVVEIAGGGDVICVEDDGPGLSEAEAAQALARGMRLDERGDGHGLGLAIASEIAAASGAELSLGRARLGGLRVSVRWTDAAET